MKRSMLVLTIALAFNVQSTYAMGALKAAISASRAVGAEGAKIAEESVKVFSAAEKAQQFIHRGYRITPDLQKGGYWIESLGGAAPVWVNNAQEVYKHIDVITKGVK